MNVPNAIKQANDLKSDKTLGGTSSIYGSLDGLVNTYSTTKSFFDFKYCLESQAVSFDEMHNWVVNPLGFIITITSSLFFMIIANRANVYEKSRIGDFWKGFREFTQALRNAFKGLRSAILTTAIFTPQDLRYLLMPTHLVFGSLYVINRMIMLEVNKERKNKEDANRKLFTDLMTFGTFNIHPKDKSNQLLSYEQIKKHAASFRNRYIIYKDDRQKEHLIFINHQQKIEQIKNVDIHTIKKILEKQNNKTDHLLLVQLNELLPTGVALKHFNALKQTKIKQQPPNQRILYYLLRTYNGFFDGLYLYLGIITLVLLPAHTIILATTLSVLYCILCIVSRIYEEYQQQHDIEISQHKIELALAEKELQCALIRLNETAAMIAQTKDVKQRAQLEIKQKQLDAVLDAHVKIFEKKRHSLQKAREISFISVILIGIKHGLPIYGALISAVFAATFICFLLSTPVSPLFVLGVITSGLPIILGCVAHAWWINKQHINQLQKNTKTKSTNLGQAIAEIKGNLKLINQDTQDAEQVLKKQILTKGVLIDSITEKTNPNPIADTFITYIAEMFRSFFAGFMKGKKEIEFLFCALQVQDASGHFQDTPLMLFFIIPPVALLYAYFFAKKAFIKGYARLQESMGNYDDLKASKPIIDQSKSKKPSIFDLENKVDNTKSLPKQPTNISIPGLFFSHNTRKAYKKSMLSKNKPNNAKCIQNNQSYREYIPFY